MDEDPSPDLDIAAQMGFASFGANPMAKKRKYNPATDAVVSVTQLTKLGSEAVLPRKPPPTVNGGGVDGFRGGRGGGVYAGSRGSERGRGGGRGWGGEGGNMGRGRGRGRGTRNEQGSTGSNNTPLGVRVARGGGQGVGTTALPNGEDEDDDDNDEDMPGYVDDTPPDSPAHTSMSIRPTHPKMDGSTQSGDEPVPAPPEEKGDDGDPESQGMDIPLSSGRNVDGRIDNEGRPASSSLPIRPPGGYDWAALKRGVRNEQGDLCYYDASFVEDPWAKLLEKGGTAREGAGS